MKDTANKRGEEEEVMGERLLARLHTCGAINYVLLFLDVRYFSGNCENRTMQYAHKNRTRDCRIYWK